MNKAISSIPQEDVNVIVNKWIKTEFVKQVDYSIIWKIMIAVIIVIIIILIWARSLKKEIRNRKKAEDALEKNGQRLQTILDNASVAITMKNLDGRYVLINKYFEQVIGINENEVIGKTDEEIFDDDLVKRMIETDRKAILSGEIKTAELDAKLKDGSLHSYISTKIPLKDKSGKIYALCGISTDITVLKQIQNELADAKKIAEDATKSKSDFLANMSHEIRTPMNAVMGMTHLAMQTELTEKQYNYLEKIDLSAKSLLNIINDILDFSKIEAGKMDIEKIDFDLNKVLDNLANIISVKAKEKDNLELLFDVAPSVPRYLVGDPLRLGQILINLCNNAVKFTEKGEIIIRIKSTDIQDGKANIKFSINDTGVGMNKQQINKLFKSFSQADTSTTRKFGGTGLGLSISKHLVEMMDGKITVESEYGLGSIFSFDVVLTKQEGKNENDKFLPTPDLRALKVLVVDDNRDSCEILQTVLESFSFKVKTVNTGSEALKELEKNALDDPYKLVIVDWKMPEMDGLETIRNIKGNDKISLKPKFIMITAYGKEGITKQAEVAGAVGFLVKPFNNSVLFDTVIECFKQERSNDKKIYIREKKEKIDIKPIQGAKVLLTDDNEINCQVATELLESMSLEVIVAKNGQDAVNKVAEYNFDIVLMDIQMPVMDGFEATKLIRKNGKKNIEKLPIVAMTANAMSGDREKSLSAGMNDNITKPIDPEKLLQSMLKWISKGEREIPEHIINTLNKAGKIDSYSELSELNAISIEKGLRNVNNNKELYRSLLIKFYAENNNTTEKINQALKNNNIKIAQRIIHTVKGLAGSIGGGELQSAAGKLELSIINNEIDEIKKNISDFDVKLNRVLNSLSKLGKKSVAADSKPSGSIQKFKKLLGDLEEYTRKRQLKQSKNIVKELKSYLWSNECSKEINDICNMIRVYKFEKAHEIIVMLLGKI